MSGGRINQFSNCVLKPGHGRSVNSSINEKGDCNNYDNGLGRINEELELEQQPSCGGRPKTYIPISNDYVEEEKQSPSFHQFNVNSSQNLISQTHHQTETDLQGSMERQAILQDSSSQDLTNIVAMTSSANLNHYKLMKPPAYYPPLQDLNNYDH